MLIYFLRRYVPVNSDFSKMSEKLIDMFP